MKEETKRFIDKLVKVIKLEYNIKAPIKDMESIVTSLGGKVKIEDFNKLLEGSIKRVGKDNFEIRVPPKDDPYIKNIFLAKNIGHLFLHMGFRTNNVLWENQSTSEYRYFDNDDAIVQAEFFANNFLIPKQELVEILKIKLDKEIISYEDLDEISRYFYVPKNRLLSYLLREGVLNYFQER